MVAGGCTLAILHSPVERPRYVPWGGGGLYPHLRLAALQWRPALLLRYAPSSSPLRAHLFSVTRTPLLRYAHTSSPLPAHLFSVTRPPLLRYAPTSSPLRAHLFSVTRPALLRNAPSPSPLSAHLFSLPCPARLLPMPSVSPPRPAFPFGEFVAGPGVSSSPEQSNSEGTRKKT